jgi:predicted nucleotidyltransferase
MNFRGLFYENKKKIKHMKKGKNKGAVKENWVMEESIRAMRAEAEKRHGKSKMSDIGKKYERVPHPTIKNTFILREKKN